MTHTPRTTLLVNASVLQDLFAKNPEVEIELIRNAADQVAAAFKRKVTDTRNFEGIVNRLIGEINSKLSYKYHLPDNVLKVIQEAAAEQFAKYTEEQMQKAFDTAFEAASQRLTRRIEVAATEAVERKVAAIFAQAARMAK